MTSSPRRSCKCLDGGGAGGAASTFPSPPPTPPVPVTSPDSGARPPQGAEGEDPARDPGADQAAAAEPAL